MYVKHMYSGAHGDEKKALDLLEQKLKMGVSCHNGIRNWTQVLWKSNKYFSSLSLSPAPKELSLIPSVYDINNEYLIWLLWDFSKILISCVSVNIFKPGASDLYLD